MGYFEVLFTKVEPGLRQHTSPAPTRRETAEASVENRKMSAGTATFGTNAVDWEQRVDLYRLREGMVFALETYWPSADGLGAARIEEELVVTADGHPGPTTRKGVPSTRQRALPRCSP
jgi:hypothetical protein